MSLIKNDFSQITHRLYLGSIAGMEFADRDNDLYIKSFLNCTKDSVLCNLDYMQLNLDDGEYIPEITMTKAIDFIHHSIHNGNILVACHAGMSRSPGIVILYLMSCGFSYNESYNLVKEKRPVIFPAPKIIQSIVDYSNKYFYGGV